jgi:nitrogen fixation NifU-like protein
MQSFYREILLDHFEHPRNRRELEDSDIHEHLDNPLCGDTVTVYAKVHDGTFEEVSFTGRGCSISQASASMRTEEKEELGELAALKGVVQTPNRIRCATLAWDAMRRALPTL